MNPTEYFIPLTGSAYFLRLRYKGSGVYELLIGRSKEEATRYSVCGSEVREWITSFMKMKNAYIRGYHLLFTSPQAARMVEYLELVLVGAGERL